MKLTGAIILISILGITTAEEISKNSQHELTQKETLPNFEQLIDGGETPWLIYALQDKEHHFNVTNNDTVCIMLYGNFTFSVTYLTGKMGTNTVKMNLPQYSDHSFKIDGSCVASAGQWIQISWGADIPKSSMKLSFNVSESGKSWVLVELETTIVLDNETFPNATASGGSLNSIYLTSLHPQEIPFNRSYKCFSEITNINSSTYLDSSPYPYPVIMSMEAVQIQAYNDIPLISEFTRPRYCHRDKAADFLPTVVGCILFAVIFLILGAHFCCPHNSNSEYEPI